MRTRLTSVDVYVFPRYTVIPSHANKAFVPYTHAFEPRPGDTLSPSSLPNPSTIPTAESESTSLASELRVRIHGNVSSLSSHSVTFTRLSSDGPERPAGGVETIDFDYMIYSLGASLPSPVDVWGIEASGLSIEGSPMGCKKRGVRYMHQRAETMKKAKSVLVVGGGALGIRQSLVFPWSCGKLTLNSRTGVRPQGCLPGQRGHTDSFASSIDADLSRRDARWR